MDVASFRAALMGPISRRLADFKLSIDLDELPSCVEFTVISDDFEDVDPADRIQFLADVIEEAFGLPLKFRPMGLALTPAEVASGEWDDELKQDHRVDADEGSAARALD